MKLPIRFIFGGLSLLFLIALAVVLSRENIPWIGGLILFIGLGAFPFYFFLFALFASSEPFPTYKQLGLPEPEAMQEGVITVRFWTGNLANISAAIVVDPQQDEILFIRRWEDDDAQLHRLTMEDRSTRPARFNPRMHPDWLPLVESKSDGRYD